MQVKVIRFFALIFILGLYLFVLLITPSFGQVSKKIISDSTAIRLAQTLPFGLQDDPKVEQLQLYMAQHPDPDLYPQKVVDGDLGTNTDAARKRLLLREVEVRKSEEILEQVKLLAIKVDSLSDSLRTLSKFVMEAHAPIEELYAELSLPALRDSLQMFVNIANYYTYGGKAPAEKSRYPRKVVRQRISLLWRIVGEKEKSPRIALASYTKPVALNTSPYVLDWSTGVKQVSSDFDDHLRRGHEGAIDIPVRNAKIRAAVGGKVTNVQSFQSNGKTLWEVTVTHALQDLRVIYRVLSSVESKIEIGKNVFRGDVIGISGAYWYQGRWQYHLHFQVERFINGNWVQVDPELYLKK
jgi:murein DD-endopeptidase MepM/ murein hydrolase activator NlpD